MTIRGKPVAANAQTTSNRSKFSVVIPLSGSNKDDKKNARVVIRDIIAACNEEKLARCSSAGYWSVTEDDETSRLYEAPRNKVITRCASP